MNNQSHVVSVKAKYAQKRAFEHLHHSINTLQKNVVCMESYLEKFETATDDVERVQILNSAILQLVCNIQPNLGIEKLAESQAEIAKLGA